MKHLLIILFLFLIFGLKAQANTLSLSHKVQHELQNYCLGNKPTSRLGRAILNLAPTQRRCHKFLKDFSLTANTSELILKGTVATLHLHVPKLKIIEEEDDFLNDDLYMWFVITRDGIPQTKVTKIYKGFDEGDTLIFDSEDRVISNLPFYSQMIVDYGIVESDGDDITEMQRLSSHALNLITIALGDTPPQERDSIIANLRDETNAVMQLLLGLDHDDKLVTGSIIVDYRDTFQAWQNGGVLKREEVYTGSHFGSDWKYQLTWRFLMVDIHSPPLF